MVAFRRPKSLKDRLVHSEFKNPGLIKGCVECGNRRCKICKSMVKGNILPVGLLVEAM